MLKIKRLIKNNRLLFWFWYHLYRKRRGVFIDWFKSNSILYVDGYPRSGNTFFLHLIRNIYPGIHFVHHFHAIAPIKEALFRKIPVFVLLRDPSDAISSYYLKDQTLRGNSNPSLKNIDKKRLSRMVRNYSSYYGWVKSKQASLNIIHFDELITEPIQVLRQVNLSLPIAIQIDFEVLSNKVQQHKSTSFGAKDTYGASLPNREKERAKQKIKSMLMQTPGFEDCRQVYADLN